MLIEWELLSPEALEGLVEEYCLRDWGLNDIESPLASRKDSVKKGLKSGVLLVQYSEEEESAHIISADSLHS